MQCLKAADRHKTCLPRPDESEGEAQNELSKLNSTLTAVLTEQNFVQGQ